MTIRSLLVMLCLGLLACSCSRKTEPTRKQLGRHVSMPSLPDGIYLVLGKAGTASDLSAAEGTRVIEYEHPHDEDEQGPREFFLVRQTPDVPMSLAAPARVEGTPPDDISLHLSFTPEAAETLERVTTELAGKGGVAVLIGGKVASAHKIRTPITGGKLQISCCGPGVCDHLRRQLATVSD